MCKLHLCKTHTLIVDTYDYSIRFLQVFWVKAEGRGLCILLTAAPLGPDSRCPISLSCNFNSAFIRYDICLYDRKYQPTKRGFDRSPFISARYTLAVIMGRDYGPCDQGP